MRRVCLVGVRGVGKTTLLRRVLPNLEPWEHIVGSRVLRELVGADFSNFDALPEPVKTDYRRQAIAWMEAHQSRTGLNLLCDGHTTLIDLDGGVEQVFTDEDCRFFRELILLEAPAAVVLERRRLDRKPRRPRTLAQVQAELDGERGCCRRLARQWGLTLHELPPNDLEQALREALQ
jgi:adenylate kinase